MGMIAGILDRLKSASSRKTVRRWGRVTAAEIRMAELLDDAHDEILAQQTLIDLLEEKVRILERRP